MWLVNTKFRKAITVGLNVVQGIIYLGLLNAPDDMLQLTAAWIFGILIFGQVFLWADYFALLAYWIRDKTPGWKAALSFGGTSIIFTLIQIILYAGLYKKAGVSTTLPNLNSWDYVYFSTMTWTTVGYGDITPGAGSRILASSEALTGYIFMGIFIGTLGSLLFGGVQRKLDKEREERRIERLKAQEQAWIDRDDDDPEKWYDPPGAW